jgi:signal peptide peptidase SppA
MGGATQANAALYKNNAAIKKTEAANQWSYFQSKSTKQNLSELGLDLAPVQKKEFYEAEIKRYKEEKIEIKAKADQLEAESVDWDKKSDDEMHQHHRWAQATTVLQVSIALAAIALLTRKKWLKVGMYGVGFAAMAVGLGVLGATLLEFKQTGKPLVASMSSVAASGGYWIAAPADEIWAAPTTITGSIGVLSAFPSFSRGLGEIGITTDGLGTTAIAGGLDPSRPLSPQWEQILRLSNDNAYQRFLSIVSEGRGMPVEKVAEIAEGRVWTGTRALQNGLIDKLGSLDDAVKSAAAREKLEDYDTRTLEPPGDWRQEIVRALAGGQSAMLRRFGAVFGVAGLDREPLLLLLQGADPMAPYAFCSACVAP